MLDAVHVGLAWVVVIGNGIAGTWALVAHWNEWARHRLLWAWTAMAEIALIVEVAIGVALQNTEDVTLDSFHAFYGFVGLASIGIIYSYRAQLQPYRYLLYGGGGLFLMGLALRSVQFRSPVVVPAG